MFPKVACGLCWGPQLLSLKTKPRLCGLHRAAPIRIYYLLKAYTLLNADNGEDSLDFHCHVPFTVAGACSEFLLCVLIYKSLGHIIIEPKDI